MAKTLQLAGALGHGAADKRLEILRRIGAGGSISQAARDTGVSYKAAWQAVDTLTNLAGVELVEKMVGGAGGGGARITAAGLQLLAAADALEKARGQVLNRIRKSAGASQAAGRLAIRTSMRNQLPCSVEALEGEGHIVRVQLRLPNGAMLVSRITRESAELLALRPGQQVLALCKATAVTVGRLADAGRSAANALAAKATRVSRSDSGDEVAAEIDGRLQLVGFAAPGSRLRSGSRVLLTLQENAVVIALTG